MANEDDLEQTSASEPKQDILDPSSPKKKNWLRISLTTALVLVVVGLAAYRAIPYLQIGYGILWFTTASESHEDRYGDIDRILEKLDYTTAGAVVEESYDNSNHPLDPASFEATVQGPDAFATLSERLLEAMSGRHCSTSETATRCTRGNPSVRVLQQTDGTVLIQIRD